MPIRPDPTTSHDACAVIGCDSTHSNVNHDIADVDDEVEIEVVETEMSQLEIANLIRRVLRDNEQAKQMSLQQVKAILSSTWNGADLKASLAKALKERASEIINAANFQNLNTNPCR